MSVNPLPNISSRPSEAGLDMWNDSKVRPKGEAVLHATNSKIGRFSVPRSKVVDQGYVSILDCEPVDFDFIAP